MTKDPSTARPTIANLMLPPSARMLVDGEFLMQELAVGAQRSDAQAGPPFGDAEMRTVGTVGTDMRGNRRSFNFAHIYVEGLLYDYYAQWVSYQIQQANADDTIHGILLEVNTGGGAVTAAQMIRSALEDGDKPVVAYTHFSASGGMLATMHADEIVAAGRMTRVGSIGTMRSLPKWYAEMYAKYMDEVYATTSPDKNADWRKYVETLDSSVFIAELDKLDALFMSAMADARPLNAKLKDTTLAGGVWLADEAKQRGLIDSIGGYNYALNRLASYAANKPNS